MRAQYPVPMSASDEFADDVQIVVLVRGSTRKLYSEPMTLEIAREQIDLIRRALKASPDEHIDLDWISILAGELLSAHIGR